ncbi:Protein FAM102B [Nymphon striatum]|nr:Protein FAM102B [Nymphon striatum]
MFGAASCLSAWSGREEVINHCVKWNFKPAFQAKMTANANTGVLEPCVMRMSLRKELKGGKSSQKLGFRDLNLAEFAGSGLASKRFPLEGYDSKHRQDNSLLKIKLEMFLISGDPCFKAPSVTQLALPGEQTEDHLQLERKGDDFSGGSVASGGSSGFGSLPRKNRPSVLASELVAGTDHVIEGGKVAEKLLSSSKSTTSLPDEFKLTHSRNSSYTSQQSKLSGYSSLHSHSRQGSADSGHVRNTSCGSGFGDIGGTVPKVPDRKRISSKKQHAEEQKESRIDMTRVNADQLIDELILESNLEKDENAETSGLQLFIGKDGSAALGSHELKTKLSTDKYKPVVIDHR